jgi:hypothetical protein
MRTPFSCLSFWLLYAVSHASGVFFLLAFAESYWREPMAEGKDEPRRSALWRTKAGRSRLAEGLRRSAGRRSFAEETQNTMTVRS